MTFEEAFEMLCDKLGAGFNWTWIAFTEKSFTEEAYREIQKGHLLYGRALHSVAKCESNDDVLFVTGDREGNDIYMVLHLTYSAHNLSGYPRFAMLGDLGEAIKYLEMQYENEYVG